MSTLPLRYRLPNPPADFVNRKAEIDWLAESVKLAPVTVIWGPGGLGKTALVLQALHRRFKRRVERTLLVRLPSALGGDELRGEVLRALDEVQGPSAVDGPGLEGTAEEQTEAIVDLAERGGWWVVLDDLHHGDPEATTGLLHLLSRYARRSRWIGTSQRAPGLGDEARVLKLGALEEPQLFELARAWGRTDERVPQAVAASGGSPWLLQQCLATGRTESSLTRETVLADLPQQAVRWLEAASVLDVALPPETIHRFAPALDSQRMASMEARGLIERTAGGVQVHEVVRSVLKASQSEQGIPWASQAGWALAEDPHAVAQLEAVRLAAEQGDIPLLCDILDRHAEALLAGGYSPRLWHFLEPLTDDRIAGWRLRCATQLGNPTALHKVQQPPEPDPVERIAWAQALFVQGQLGEAEAIASAVASHGGAGDRVRAEATLLHARSLAARGQVGAALYHLRSISESDESIKRRCDAETALCLLALGEWAEATRLADALRAQIGLPGQAEQEVGELAWTVASIYRVRGRLGDAAELLQGVRSATQGDAPALLAARRLLWLRARVDIDRGRLDEAETTLERLSPFIRSGSLARPPILTTRAMLSVARGRLDEAEALVSRVRRETSLFGLYGARLEGEAIEVQLATLGARADPSESPSGGSPEAEHVRLRRHEHALRRGDSPDADELSRLEGFREGELGALSACVRARHAHLRGDGDQAVAWLDAGARHAASSGFRVAEAELRDTLCEVFIALGRLEEAAQQGERLRRLAQQLGSDRFGGMADFYEAAAAPRLPAAVLERLAADDRVAPPAARWARLLIAGGSAEAAGDRAVIAALRARWEAPEPALAPVGLGGSWQPGWGLDEPRRVVWLPDGREVDFTRRSLHWRVLEILVQHGGWATKEQLVRGAWEESEYHPLRHDARLQVAIRKLRELVEQDPSSPTRILTLEDGYGLAAPVRRIRST
jgi:tetratricopeptide (TPR) repeat protein